MPKHRTKKHEKRNKSPVGFSIGSGYPIFFLSVLLLVLVPLALTTAVYRVYVLPKFLLLLVGSSALVPLMLFYAIKASRHNSLNLLKTNHVMLVCLYFLAVSISTAFGVARMASLFGSVYNQMGLITHLCFLVCFIGLILGINVDEPRFKHALWAIALTGLLVSLYAVGQFFRFDPFVPSSMYTLNLASGDQIRVAGTLGHSNYLGNFLLYTSPLSASLALATTGYARHLATAAVVLSIAAIGCSGARGAWLGFIAGMITFAAFELSGSANIKARRVITLRKVALCLIIIPALIWMISLSPASNLFIARIRSFTAEGLTGSGRTILWRDSTRMVPDSSVIGTGPEGFRKEFLLYKSKELARLSPANNSESSHNAYLDAAISYGLPGAILYIAMIASAISLLIRARRRAAAPSMKLIITGLVASQVAVLVHNFFIYDQISTGLYFFAFIALAQIALNVAGTGVTADRLKLEGRREFTQSPADQGGKIALLRQARIRAKGAGWPKLGIAVTVCVCVLALWYSADLLRSDIEIKQALVSSRTEDFDAMARHGERAARSVEPTGAYHFLFVSLLAETISNANAGSRIKNRELDVIRSRAFALADAYSNKLLAHTLTPELNNLLLAYLAWATGQIDKTYAYASEVLKWDPINTEGRWLMAEALLAKGNRGQALREAELALDITPGSREAKSVLMRARLGSLSPSQNVERLISRGIRLAGRGDMEGARRILLRAIRLSNGPCPECHRRLALLYEEADLYNGAIDEWRIVAREERNETLRQEAQMRMEMLSRKTSP
jgi:O-antigen ligase